MTDEQVEAEARRLYALVFPTLSWVAQQESIKDVWRDEARVQLAKEAPR